MRKTQNCSRIPPNIQIVNTPPKESLSYRDAGVDIDAGDALVEAIKPYARRTMRP